MMLFPFRCPACGREADTAGRVGVGPFETPTCWCRPGGVHMERQWQAPQLLVRYSDVDYLLRAARGEETVPGFTRQEVVDTLESGRKRPIRKPKRQSEARAA